MTAMFCLLSWEAYKNIRAQAPEFVDLAALQAGNAPLGYAQSGIALAGEYAQLRIPGVNAKSLEAKLKIELHAWLASHVPDIWSRATRNSGPNLINSRRKSIQPATRIPRARHRNC